MVQKVVLPKCHFSADKFYRRSLNFYQLKCCLCTFLYSQLNVPSSHTGSNRQGTGFLSPQQSLRPLELKKGGIYPPEISRRQKQNHLFQSESRSQQSDNQTSSVRPHPEQEQTPKQEIPGQEPVLRTTKMGEEYREVMFYTSRPVRPPGR